MGDAFEIVGFRERLCRIGSRLRFNPRGTLLPGPTIRPATLAQQAEGAGVRHALFWLGSGQPGCASCSPRGTAAGRRCDRRRYGCWLRHAGLARNGSVLNGADLRRLADRIPSAVLRLSCRRVLQILARKKEGGHSCPPSEAGGLCEVLTGRNCRIGPCLSLDHLLWQECPPSFSGCQSIPNSP